VVAASIERLQQLQERRWEEVAVLVIYVDGQQFADHHIISAVGVDAEGRKHIWGIEPGAIEEGENRRGGRKTPGATGAISGARLRIGVAQLT
jgi:transposase-like protein